MCIFSYFVSYLTNQIAMKFSYSLKQKTKIALLLFCIMACTILIRLLEDKSIKDMGTSFVSMYNDRLVPATDLFLISEKIHAKRHLLASTAGKPSPIILQKSATIDRSIDSLLTKYEKTFLVKSEQRHLQGLKTSLAESRALELKIQENASSASALDLELAKKSYAQISAQLLALTQIQTRVGNELMSESKEILTGSKLYSSIQFALAIVIGILIVSIIFASNAIKVNQEKFNLN